MAIWNKKEDLYGLHEAFDGLKEVEVEEVENAEELDKIAHEILAIDKLIKEGNLEVNVELKQKIRKIEETIEKNIFKAVEHTKNLSKWVEKCVDE